MQAVCQCSLGQLSSPELAGLRAYPSILPLPAVRDVRSRPRGDQRVLGVAECLCLLICVYQVPYFYLHKCFCCPPITQHCQANASSKSLYPLIPANGLSMIGICFLPTRTNYSLRPCWKWSEQNGSVPSVVHMTSHKRNAFAGFG